MLEKIKSSYIEKNILNILNERIKLKLIKYNKSLQKKMNIKLINYQRFSGRYIIYETKKEGREYDGYNNKLLFEGEYLNGERNGKGKEIGTFFSITFEGEYLNGKRNGKGKEYYSGE